MVDDGSMERLFLETVPTDFICKIFALAIQCKLQTYSLICLHGDERQATFLRIRMIVGSYLVPDAKYLDRVI